MPTDTSLHPPSRVPPKGSEILLAKIPFHAQTQQFLQHAVDDPQAEMNTLSYGAETYPLLALVRACRASAAATTSTTPSRGLLSAETYSAPFRDITSATLYNIPFQRKWQAKVTSTTESPAGAQDAPPASVSGMNQAAEASRGLRLRREADLLDAAVGCATARDCIARTVRPLAVVVGRAAHQQRHAQKTEEERSSLAPDAATDDLKGNEHHSKNGVNGHSDRRRRREDEEAPTEDPEDADGVNAISWWFTAHAKEGREETRSGYGKPTAHRATSTGIYGDDGTLPYGFGDHSRKGAKGLSTYQRNLFSVTDASPEEAVVLRSIHTKAPATSASGATAAATGIVGPVASDQWSGRMASLVSSSLSSANPDSSSGEGQQPQQQLVQTYLRRVAWLEKQRKAARTPVVAIDISAGATPRWSSLSAAERVRLEMEHVNQQRKRFRRERKGPGNHNDGDS